MGSQPINCEMCRTSDLLEYYACQACGMDMCISCVNHFGREAHQLRRGDHHKFDFKCVRPATCDVCMKVMDGDFVRCQGCHADDIPTFYDICMDCLITKNSMMKHARSRGKNHTFKRIDHVPAIPLKPPVRISVTNSDKYTAWKCDQCSSRLHGKAFVCLECSCNDSSRSPQCDLCDDCAEKGAISKHVRETDHSFIWFMLEIQPRQPERLEDARPPPYDQVRW